MNKTLFTLTATPLCLAAASASAQSGSSAARFGEPDVLSTSVFSEVSPTVFTFGDSTDGSLANVVFIEGLSVDAAPGSPFPLFELRYLNGVTQSGSEILALNVAVELTLTAPAATVSNFEVNLPLETTTNSGVDPLADADVLSLTGIGEDILLGADGLRLQLLGFGGLDDAEFAPTAPVFEQELTTTNVFAVVVPEPASAGLLLGGAVTLLCRRRAGS